MLAVMAVVLLRKSNTNSSNFRPAGAIRFSSKSSSSAQMDGNALSMKDNTSSCVTACFGWLDEGAVRGLRATSAGTLTGIEIKS